jgi:hypothetical protein
VLENSETEDWDLFHNNLDYVHMRSMGPCFDDFAGMVRKSFEHLVPGGWLELQDGSFEVFSEDGTTAGTALERWFNTVSAGALSMGRDMRKGPLFKSFLCDAGFVDVVEHMVPIPITPWPENRAWKHIGMYIVLPSLRLQTASGNLWLPQG